MNKYVTLEQAWIVITECDLCRQEMEISEFKYIEMNCRPLCEQCIESGVVEE